MRPTTAGRRSGRTPVLVTVAAALLLGALGTGAASGAPGDPSQPDPTPSPAPAPVDPRPDVVVVLTDDQRPETLAWMPEVQRLLVERGTTYRQAMVPTSLCCPSRATILTGRYAHTTRVFGNGDVGGGRLGGWPRFHRTGSEQRTVAVRMQQAGYRTGLVGKYLNYFGNRAEPGHVAPGWDTFTVQMSKHGRYYRYRLSDGTAHGSEPQDYSTDVFASRAVDFVRSTPRDQPMFLFFAPYGPHAPYTPAPRHLGALEGRLPQYVPRTLRQPKRTMPRWMRARKSFTQAEVDLTRLRQHESMLSVDEAVASIHDALAETGRERDTLFVFTSDNGYFWGEHRIIGKDSPYQDSTRVPMVVRWDGRVPAGATSDRLVLNVDIAETVTTAAGVGMRTDGLDMLGVRRRSGFVLEAMTGYHERPPYCGWRTRNRMYVQWGTGEEELFDYRRDRYERRNRADEPAWQELRRRMRAKAKAACVPAPPAFRW